MSNLYTFVISHKTSNDPSIHRILADAQALGFKVLTGLEYQDLYFVEGELSEIEKKRLLGELLSDPVSQYGHEQKNNHQGQIIEVALRPGVTDPVAEQIVRGAQLLGIKGVKRAATGQRFLIKSDHQLHEQELHTLAQRLLANPVIHHYSLGAIDNIFPQIESADTTVATIPLRELDKSQLVQLSQQRRAALDEAEMLAIQRYYRDINRDPTDVEFEMIAQTWSEHCCHKTFRAEITTLPDHSDEAILLHQNAQPTHPCVGAQREKANAFSDPFRPPQGGKGPKDNIQGPKINSLLKTYIKAATDEIAAPWVVSAFVDNAGIIEFDDQYQVAFKVETHNHPSAIEPFGGANTGLGGVIRDVLGVSAKPIAATDIFCFGPQDSDLNKLPEGTLHPRRIRTGVVAGVQDYGNKTGIPTVNGAIYYDSGYTANPLVFCGCVGLLPANKHPRQPQAGDRIIVLGGRTGRDGLRGATFSSMTMDAQTGMVAGASVQIGDPIIAKGLIEVVTRARDAGLYHAITDCGAGGLSSAVGEMASTIGAEVNIAKVPLKYQGLTPWEIWLSEAQERMVVAVPSANLDALQSLCDTFAIELTDIGQFKQSGKLVVRYDDKIVLDLANEFLHEGMPRKTLTAKIPANVSLPTASKQDISADTLLLKLLSQPNIASKENVIRRYDHEVQGGTVVKPLTGVKNDGPSDACVIKPQGTTGKRGIVLANGLNPEIGKYDSYAMAVSAIDEAIRNAVAVGADPTRIAILDNFCWGDPKRPETLGALIETCRGCYDGAIHYQTPFISGKDSLNNEFIGTDGQRHAIPGTLLISAIGIIPDVTRAVTMDFKKPGNVIYLLGETGQHFVGSHYLLCGGAISDAGTAPTLPKYAPLLYRNLHQAMQQQLIRSCHDLSEGGLAVAAAEMCIAGRLGCQITLAANDVTTALFSESNGRLLVEIEPQNCQAFEACFTQSNLVTKIGTITTAATLSISHTTNQVFSLPIDRLVAAWTG